MVWYSIVEYRNPNSGLQYSYGVDYRILRWIYFWDPPRGLVGFNLAPKSIASALSCQVGASTEFAISSSNIPKTCDTVMHFNYASKDLGNHLSLFITRHGRPFEDMPAPDSRGRGCHPVVLSSFGGKVGTRRCLQKVGRCLCTTKLRSKFLMEPIYRLKEAPYIEPYVQR